MKRILPVSVLSLMLFAALSCGGNSAMDDTEAAVFLSVTSYDYGTHPGGWSNYDVPVCEMQDIWLDTVEISSFPKDPDGVLSHAQDVTLTRWQVTPYRVDGNTASPVWTRDFELYIPAGSSSTLDTHNYYPSELYLQQPLINLFPENGGVDPETGLTNIRQSLRIEFFGRTVSGKAVKCSKTFDFNFMCSVATAK